MTFEEYLEKPPDLHTWDGGKTWNSGGFYGDQLRTLNALVERAGGGRAVLETGAGNSTLAFLFAGPSKLISIAPDENLRDRILAYCREHGVDTSPLNYVADRSEWALPRLAERIWDGGTGIDLALIDGAHGWPSPFVDFCYVNTMVPKGGIIVIDDVQLHSVKELARLLHGEKGSFTLVEDLGKALAFRKETGEQFLPDWDQEAYIVERTAAYTGTRDPYALFPRRKSWWERWFAPRGPVASL